MNAIAANLFHKARLAGSDAAANANARGAA